MLNHIVTIQKNKVYPDTSESQIDLDTRKTPVEELQIEPTPTFLVEEVPEPFNYETLNLSKLESPLEIFSAISKAKDLPPADTKDSQLGTHQQIQNQKPQQTQKAQVVEALSAKSLSRTLNRDLPQICNQGVTRFLQNPKIQRRLLKEVLTQGEELVGRRRLIIAIKIIATVITISSGLYLLITNLSGWSPL
jgi:hypothetical protein